MDVTLKTVMSEGASLTQSLPFGDPIFRQVRHADEKANGCLRQLGFQSPGGGELREGAGGRRRVVPGPPRVRWTGYQ